MKLAITFALLVMSTLSFGASKTISQCAVNTVKGYAGARVNLLQTDDGAIKANFIQGTTVSGTLYHLKEVSPGVFSGSIKNKPDFKMELVISKEGKANQYINGFSASLSVVYPDLRLDSGKNSLKTTASDEFVCGKKVSNF